MPEYPSGTVAFLFTDIAGSTRLWETQREAMSAAVARHFVLLDEAVTAQDGILFKRIGDAAQAAFPTVPHALRAAVDAQFALRRAEGGELGPLRVRMAIHAGEAMPQGGDYLAPALNRLSRVLATGYGEQILLTQAARALATSLPLGYALQDLGTHRLRDLIEAEQIFQLAGPGLPTDFPPLQSLLQQLTNLPTQPAVLIGREREVASLRNLLSAPGARLVTLVGPGGTGKTRLALQAAVEAVEAFPDGVWWVPLSTVADPELVPQAIATSLGLRESPAELLVKTLADHLRSRRVLLLLDNCEHLSDVAFHVQHLLDAAPGLVVLATSREPLRLRVEQEVPVEPLPLPPQEAVASPADALASPAVRLFVERAQAIKAGFALDAGNVADVVAICQRLDGLPLALELAAARIRILTPAALLVRLDRRLAILTGGARDLPARQQTLRTTIAWSYDLLVPAERVLFARLAIFAGGCTWGAAEAVCSAAGGLPLDLFDGVDSLLQKSLLRREDGPGGDPRFAMLGTIQEFALERLHDLPEAGVLRQVHADTFLALAEEANWDDPGQAALLARLEADHANFRQALAYYTDLAAEGLARRTRLAAALAHFWREHGHLSEGRRELEAVIAAQGTIPPADRAAALEKAALLAEAQGDLDAAERLQEDALALHRETGDLAGVADSLTGLGVIARQRGDLETATSRHQEALETWRSTGDRVGIAGAHLDLGLLRQMVGDYGGAEPALHEGLRLFRQLGDDLGAAHALHYLGLLDMARGTLPQAIDWFGESLGLWRAMGVRQMVATDLANLGEAHHLSGSLDEARRLYQDALALFARLGDARGQSFLLAQLGLLALDRANFREAHELLREGLELRWRAGLRGSAAETLEALAEASARTGAVECAATLLQTADLLRKETGLVRQPVYEERHRQVLALVADHLPAALPDVDQVVADVISKHDAAAPTDR